MQRAGDLVLDYTLRHLYSALRHQGVRLLAIRFTYQGKKWEADTADEAVRLRQRLEAESRPVSDEEFGERMMWDIRLQSPWTPDVFWSFVESIGAYQKKFVTTLLESNNLSSDKLAGSVGIDEQSLGGVLSGLSKQLKRVKLKPSDLYLVSIDWSNKERRRRFHLQLEFNFAAQEMGWPEERRKKRDAASTKAGTKSETR